MKLFEGIRNLYYQFLPTICILCNKTLKSSLSLCNACERDLPILPNSCPQCAQFLPDFTDSHDEIICGACLNLKPSFDKIFALFPYHDPIPRLISALKFREELHLAKFFAHLLLKQIPTWYEHKPLPDIIIPVPLHQRRLKERAFNQAVEIAKVISHAVKIPLDKYGVTRTIDTAPQSGLKAIKRKANLHNAFKVAANYTDLNIAVIDDVVTTGHTVNSLCKSLKAHGVKNIHIWCCARRG